jgi:hypothetical protein
VENETEMEAVLLARVGRGGGSGIHRREGGRGFCEQSLLVIFSQREGLFDERDGWRRIARLLNVVFVVFFHYSLRETEPSPRVILFGESQTLGSR